MVFCGCSDQDGKGYKAPKFKKVVNLEYEQLGDDDLLPFFPAGMAISGDYLLLTYADAEEKTFHVFDKSGKLLRSGIHLGRGPGETMMGHAYMTVYGDEVTFSDLSVKERLSFSLNDFMKDGPLTVHSAKLNLPPWGSFGIRSPKGDDIWVIIRSRIKDFDRPDRIIRMETPDGQVFEDKDPVFEDRDVAHFSAMQPNVAFSPDGKRMAYCSAIGLTMELFSIDGELRKTGIRRYLPPKVRVNTQSYEYEDDFIFGHGKLYATDKNIYMAYDGETTGRDWRVEHRPGALYHNIAVFDWEGNPVALYKTDFRINNLCVEPDGSAIYFALENEEGKSILCKSVRL